MYLRSYPARFKIYLYREAQNMFMETGVILFFFFRNLLPTGIPT
jgi:hypothetical protein